MLHRLHKHVRFIEVYFIVSANTRYFPFRKSGISLLVHTKQTCWSKEYTTLLQRVGVDVGGNQGPFIFSNVSAVTCPKFVLVRCRVTSPSHTDMFITAFLPTQLSGKDKHTGIHADPHSEGKHRQNHTCSRMRWRHMLQERAHTDKCLCIFRALLVLFSVYWSFGRSADEPWGPATCFLFTL